MARMTFGSWFRPANMDDFNANEFYDVTATCGHPNWIRDEHVEQAKYLPSPAKWVRPDGTVLEYRPAYIRRREWAQPEDSTVHGADKWHSINLELKQDGSAVIHMNHVVNECGSITIPAHELETVAQWFTKAVEANKQ